MPASTRRPSSLAPSITAQRLEGAAQSCLRIHAELSTDGALAATAAEARRLLGAGVAVSRMDEAGGAPRLQASLSAAYPSLDEVPEGELRWLEAPMVGHAGAHLGSVRVAAPGDGGFREDDEALLAHLAQSAGVALENARAYEAAQDAVRARDNLLAVVSHDLRNPLNTVTLSTALLRDGVAPRDQPLIERLQRATHRINRLLGDLVDASALDQGAFPLTLRPEPASSIAREASEASDSFATSRGLRLEVTIAEDDTLVFADRDRLLQALANLLANAVQFSPPSGVIRVDLARTEGHAVFSVQDEGPGIAPERVDRLFKRHTKVNPESRDSRGLGLFIAHGIVAAHGGSLRVETAPGQGARFFFTIPLA